MSGFGNSSFYTNYYGYFDKLRIALASPEKIKQQAFGEVTKPETINYRTFKPEKHGLFCARIFGPVKDYECLCGRYKRNKEERGNVCEKCGVEITLSKVRRERMGYIGLVAPVAHIWFLKSLPSYMCTVLDMQLKDVERVLYFESYVVVDPGMTVLNKYELLSERQYNEYLEEYGEDSFLALMGAEAIKRLLQSIELISLREELRDKLHGEKKVSDIQRKKLIKRLRVVEGFISSGNKPEWMIIDALPVMPTELRPLVHLDGGRFATSDLNDLYRRVINRNNRLKNLIELNAPEIIVRNEKRMLQDSADALIDNGRRGKFVKNANKRPFKSLSDMIKGKQGRFRQNLLGKRVDYSGRSVIVVGSTLTLNQCGLPKQMALELFKPFIYSKLQLHGKAPTIKAAKRMLRSEKPEIWDYLEDVIKEHPVLLNRAPTLHRLGIQAFEPVLIEGRAIRLHPLVCDAFNADFDGDQMAVHIPLSIEAQIEARILMMSTNNILSPSNGKPIIVPTEDIVAGLYYLTLENTDEEEGEDKSEGVYNEFEVEMLLAENKVKLHMKIRCKLEYYDRDGIKIDKVVLITPGRLKLFQILPKDPSLGLHLVNRVLTNKDMSEVVDLVYKGCGQRETVIFCDKLKELGFDYATRSGISFGKNDMIVPESKSMHVNKAKAEVKGFESQYQEGLITSNERYNKVIDTWSRCTDEVAGDMLKYMSGDTIVGGINVVKHMNPVYMMAHSGARGSSTQMKQLAGMRGLMSKPSGEIIETPIISNFREGLNVSEYFISTHGARKGLADTALKTANSGYLTRRLVDVSQDCVVIEQDCKSTEGIIFESIASIGVVVDDAATAIAGRTVSNDIIDPISGEKILEAGGLITEEKLKRINIAGLGNIKIRSVLTCNVKGGVCTKCYGRDLTTGKLVSIGEAVGVIAAQSVGEPGTQLTMRTFHIGGAVTKGADVSSVDVVSGGKVKLIDSNIVKNSTGEWIVMSRACEMVLLDNNDCEVARHKIPYGSKLYYVNGDTVEPGSRVADWDPYTIPIITEKSGRIKCFNIEDGISVREILDEDTGMSRREIVDWKQKAKSRDYHPMIAVVDEKGEIIKLGSGAPARYFMPVEAILNINDGQEVHAGDILARMPRESAKSRDITGGLPRVVELFEARSSKDTAIINELDGIISFGSDDHKSKRKLIVTPHDGGEPVVFSVPKGRHITVMEGDVVKKGMLLMEGAPDLHDILRVLGVKALFIYLIYEIQKVYKMQGVFIDNKHIEIIVSQMLRKVEIIDPGDSTYYLGEEISVYEQEEANELLEKEGKDLVRVRNILQGITKASLDTKSFISAASFQDTTRVLTNAAIEGKEDPLIGLKENVIVGRLIPVGTGYMMNKWKKEGLADRAKRKKELALVKADVKTKSKPTDNKSNDSLVDNAELS